MIKLIKYRLKFCLEQLVALESRFDRASDDHKLTSKREREKKKLQESKLKLKPNDSIGSDEKRKRERGTGLGADRNRAKQLACSSYKF